LPKMCQCNSLRPFQVDKKPIGIKRNKKLSEGYF
jgi:hypothetical protein